MSKDTVNIGINVFTDKREGGTILSVKESAYLGQDVLDNVSAGQWKGFSGYRPNSKLPVSVSLTNLGSIPDVTLPSVGYHEEPNPAKFNALEWLDEPEKRNALTQTEKDKLSWIGVVEINNDVNATIENHGKWTPFVDAEQAIMQHDNGDYPSFPKQTVLVKNAPQIVEGNQAIGCDLVLTIGDDKFYGTGATVSKCNDELFLYQFIWYNVPKTVLDEP